jgi:hypothetical protein
MPRVVNLNMAVNSMDIQSDSKKMRGGSRPSAGRPRKDMAQYLAARVNPMTAAAILAIADERGKWMRLLRTDDDRVLLATMTFLTQMRDGKPAQRIDVTSQNITITADSVEKARAIVREVIGLPVAQVASAPADAPKLGAGTAGAAEEAANSPALRPIENAL